MSRPLAVVLLSLAVACSRSPEVDAPAPDGAATGSGSGSASGSGSGSGSGSSSTGQYLTISLDANATVDVTRLNQGTAIGQGAANGATPFVLANLAANPNNTETITSATNPFASTATVPDTAAGFCDYSGASPERVSYVTGTKFETAAAGDPMQPMAPFYFPLVYTSSLTPTGNAFGGQPPLIGLFDWRPKDLDEAVVVAESDDLGSTWYFMQSVFELAPDLTNPISGGYSPTATATGCPTKLTKDNGTDDGFGHAAVLQLPGTTAPAGMFLYLLDRSAGNVDSAPLSAVELTNASNKFPIWNTNSTAAGANDIKSIASALHPTAGATSPVVVQQTVGLTDPDGIMAVFPTAPGAPAGSPVTVMYVQKTVGADASFPAAQQCTAAPFSGKVNHDVATIHLATTTDGIHFTDLGAVNGLSDPTTVDYRGTRWVSPRATLLDLHGDGSRWGLLFAGGNCLDGDSDAFHFVGYAESDDRMNWTVYNGATNPIASINTITAVNQADGAMVTIPSVPPVVPTASWFAQRLYAPTLARVDATHFAMIFAGYAVQTPGTDLLAYRQVGRVVLTTSQALPAGVPNNINAQ